MLLSQKRWRQASVSILSSSLPPDVAVPATLPSFLQSLVDEVIVQPCSESLRDLYRVLGGIRTTLLELLPDSKLDALVTEIKRVLADVKNMTANMYCLASMSEIALALINRSNPSTPDSRWSHEGRNNVAVQRDWQQAALSFFEDQKGMKTMDLIILYVISACSDREDLSLLERLQVVELATKVVIVIESGHKELWLRENSAKLHKLFAKLRYGLPAACLQVAVRNNRPPAYLLLT